MSYQWVWCDVCEAATVICPQCGNNECNGHWGCDECKIISDWVEEQYKLKLAPEDEKHIKTIYPKEK